MLFAGCGDDDVTPTPTPDAGPPDAGPPPYRAECENLNPMGCLLPWPSSRYLVDDSSTRTGRRVAVPVEAIAAALGVSEEQVRLDTLNAARALGLVMDNGEPGPGEFGVADAILERLRVRPRRIRRTWRGTVADVLPAPALIVRIEREAPPVREPSAGEIFTF